MSDPLMTREEVEALLAGATGPRPAAAMQSLRDPVEAIARSHLVALDRIAELEARNDPGTTHADGCHAWGPKHYECAERRIAELEAANARLAKVLAVERGDESAAPKGWRRVTDGASWVCAGGGGYLAVSRVQAEHGVQWNWSTPTLPTGTPIVCPSAATALEAMEAADAAEKEQS